MFCKQLCPQNSIPSNLFSFNFLMVLKITCCLIAVLAVIFAYYYNRNLLLHFDDSTGLYHVAIGILSSRENFHQRQLIRDTWLNISKKPYGHLFKSWFIIGNTGCDIPLGCRLDNYDCKKWTTNTSGITESFSTNTVISRHGTSGKTLKVYHQGFSFQVHHPVVITHLGIPMKLLAPKKFVSILLRNLQNKEVIVQATIEVLNETQMTENDYIYKNVENYFLPKGYEGLVMVEGHLLHGSVDATKWNNGSGVISFNRIYISQHDFESVRFSEDFSVAPSIGFKTLYLKEFEDRASNCEHKMLEQQKQSQEISEKLVAEQKWNDMLFVDVMDTYRNLPKKLLLFYEWLRKHEHFNAVLKTDDDCIIDIEKILNRLGNDQQFDFKENWIWSRFRFGWPVNSIGKWSEYEYKAPTYPMFPCGSGYVLSEAVVKWLSKNSGELHSYQGEDVSLGIWMAAINARYIDDENWQCKENCDENSYNRAQLTAIEMSASWLAKNNCGNICHCHAT